MVGLPRYAFNRRWFWLDDVLPAKHADSTAAAVRDWIR